LNWFISKLQLHLVAFQKAIHVTALFAMLSIGCIFLYGCNQSGNNVQPLQSPDVTTVPVSENTTPEEALPTDEQGRILSEYTLSANGRPSLNVTEAAQTLSPPIGPVPDLATIYKSAYKSSSYNGVTFLCDGDTIILEIPFSISDNELTHAFVDFTLEGGECSFYPPEDSEIDEDLEVPPYINENGSVDLTEEALLYVSLSDNSCIYRIETRRKTCDLPVLFLTTDSGEGIVSREEYVSGNLLLDGNTYEVEMRGRGNASWWKFAQKSYMLRFEEDISFFGMLPCDKWVLASTYGDLSLIRNCVAMDMASCMEHLEYTPDQIPVDVFLNGEYMGVYTFSEKIEVSSERVNLFSSFDYRTMLHGGITDISFMLECGGGYIMNSYTYGLDYFSTPHSPGLYFVYPTFTESYTESMNYIIDYMQDTDRAITNGYGYEEYIHMDSWVDWFIIMELTNNTDSSFCRSSFLYKRPGERLRLGPVWDFDMAFGNFYYDNPTYACWATAEAIYAPAQNHYMTYLYESDAFMLAVQERWDEKKEELLQVALDAIDTYAAAVEASRVYNNEIRGVSNSSYQIDYLRNFVQRRYDWIDMSIHMSDFNRHPATQSLPLPEDASLSENGIPLLEPLVPSENAVPEAPAASENTVP